MIRCSDCKTLNDVDAAFCAQCAAPLSAYTREQTGAVDVVAKYKIARLDVRPRAVTLAVALDILLAIFGPLAYLMSKFMTRTTVNSDATNYLGAALGGVGLFITVIVVLPVALGMLYIAWNVWTQRPWGWLAQQVVSGLVVLAALTGKWPGVTGWRLFWLAATGILAAYWYRSETKAWYGDN